MATRVGGPPVREIGVAAGVFIALFLVAALSPVAAATSQPVLTTALVPSNAGQATADGYPGASVTFTSTLSVPTPILVFGTTMNQSGQTIGVSVQGSTLRAGGSVTFFFSAPTGVRGTFHIVIFATTATRVPLSNSSAISVQV